MAQLNALLTRLLLAASLLIASLSGRTQLTVSGKITDAKGVPLAGASVAVKDSYDGTTAGADGSFSFTVADTGRKRLAVTLTGYKPYEADLVITGGLTAVAVQLKETVNELTAVVVTAGTFEAGDQKRTTILKSVDVVTTAGQQADVVAALRTLPGAQQVGEAEGLFVRGGTGTETKTFIDGLAVPNLFYSSVPDVAQRSRFSPLLFKGTVFSTGGYSAQYGGALSSVLALETIDLPSRSEVNAIVSSAQVSFLGQRLHKNKRGSDGLNLNYNNLSPYFRIVPQRFAYGKAPEALNAELNLRRQLKNGMLKLYAYGSGNELAFNRPYLNEARLQEYFRLQNRNLFATATYTGRLSNNWQWYGGASAGFNRDDVRLRTGNGQATIFSFRPQLTNRTLQGRTVFTRRFSGLTKLYLGAEYQHTTDGIEAPDSIRRRTVRDGYAAAFAESDLYFSPKLVSRLGLRYECSSLLNKAALAPRLSLAYKFNGRSQVSAAYGTFYQKPESVFLLRNATLVFAEAAHYVLNYQRVHNGQTLRTEVFYKRYRKLVTVDPVNPLGVGNEGSGYAQGAEIFWRDKTSVKNLDYWVAYSYLDTRRRHLDYPAKVQPTFAATHTLNVVAKRWVDALSTQFSGTYAYASGRPYFNPARPLADFLTDRTKAFHSLGLQVNYLRSFGNVNSVFIVNVSNVLGAQQVFGYRYASRADAQGGFAREAVTPMAPRFFFVGLYLSIGSDRRKNILD